ncbi:type II/IV secretion system domain protein [Streptococcus urinalis 2285-97]|uniref:Type II/IV secretion system domain protein n=1 Tax=Streptococcus urinalis 2285-97 TaxID=764291 RepID=G5KET9_9STRE|nr:ATPase, T2SS/T4P/T4SS family [Streptococcus urinalis]EHJ56171.1 type II/IV secretion system domain protein [Streptococcus urinalis 2285-97]
MVQNLAKEIIFEAIRLDAQDIYMIPKDNNYNLLMRINDERRLVSVHQCDSMASIISHFKFVSGMNIGEKRRIQIGSCDYFYGEEKVSLRLSSVGDYQNRESLVIRLLHKKIKIYIIGLIIEIDC